MEGMISHARNCDISEYLSFTTRLDTMLHGTRVDESNNPMDPEQIGEAFKEALRPLGTTATELLVTYRKFNQNVFHKLEDVLTEANGILIDNNILPDLDMAARSRSELQNKRSARPQKIDPTDRAFTAESSVVETGSGSDQQILSVMQKLIHRVADNAGRTASPGRSCRACCSGCASGGAVPQPGMMVGNQRLELVASDQLLTLLNQLQPTFVLKLQMLKTLLLEQAQNLSESVGSLLQEQSSTSTLRAIDRQSSDIINLVTYLYEEIGKDMTVPIPIKELIGRTQITVLKIALEDSGFFDAAAHPARLFLNELASASLSWTESEKLGQDPVYRKMQELVTRFVRNFSGDMALVEALLGDLIAFENEFADANQEKEQKLLDEDERKHRLEEVEQYALDKIDERIRDKDISPFVQSFLKTHFHKFVVQVLLREGPGGIIWRPIMNTIDVLLWTVSTRSRRVICALREGQSTSFARSWQGIGSGRNRKA